MRYRDTTVIYWELLRAMASQPQLPSALARVANVPYNRLGTYLDALKSGGFIRVESMEGHDNYSVTPKGMDVLDLLDRGLGMLFPALT